MELLQVLLFLLLCAMGLGWLARRSAVPYPIVLVVGGGALGLLPELPQLKYDPQVLLGIVLPPILYQAALLTSWRDFKANIRTIGWLAIGLVIATTLAVGAVLKFIVPDIPWAAAFAFGAIVSPPDAVAATAILSHLNMPRRIVTVLEGESLVNDASGLVLYKFAVAAAVTGAFSLAQASGEFVMVAAGGIVIGVLMGRLFVILHRQMHDAFTEVLLSLSVPYAAYILAESAHVSGVLAVVTAGLVRGRYSPEIVSAEMRILARSMWNVLVFLLNSLIFILIGIELSAIVGRLAGQTAVQLAGWSLLVSGAAILVRFAWVYAVAYLGRAIGAGREAATANPRGEAFIVSWCGMRGIVSLAAALALPLATDSGAPFPQRDLIIFLTFIVIAVTLVLQGMTLAPLIRRMKVGSDVSAREEEQLARDAMGGAALEAIEREAATVPAATAERIRHEFTERIALAAPHGSDAASEALAARRLRLAAIRAERQELIRIWRAGRVSDDVLHHLEEELDYEEQRL
ncbi:MAG: Na+/H+ antiporter [Burkholderiales bacterium]